MTLSCTSWGVASLASRLCQSRLNSIAGQGKSEERWRIYEEVYLSHIIRYPDVGSPQSPRCFAVFVSCHPVRWLYCLMATIWLLHFQASHLPSKQKESRKAKWPKRPWHPKASLLIRKASPTWPASARVSFVRTESHGPPLAGREAGPPGILLFSRRNQEKRDLRMAFE